MGGFSGSTEEDSSLGVDPGDMVFGDEAAFEEGHSEDRVPVWIEFCACLIRSGERFQGQVSNVDCSLEITWNNESG